MKPNGLYLELGQARVRLEARGALRATVETWWDTRGWGRPPLPDVLDMAALTRQMPSARYEDVCFHAMAEQAGLTPTWLGFTGDRFAAKSPYKYSLGNRLVFDGYGRAGGPKLARDSLINIPAWDGKPLAAVVTTRGNSLVEAHAAFQDQLFPSAVRADMTQWLQQAPDKATYYQMVLSMFLAHAVLFEDYHGGESGDLLSDFTARLFEPARASLRKQFGCEPLLVALPWAKEFAYYPASKARATLAAINFDLSVAVGT